MIATESSKELATLSSTDPVYAAFRPQQDLLDDLKALQVPPEAAISRYLAWELTLPADESEYSASKAAATCVADTNFLKSSFVEQVHQICRETMISTLNFLPYRAATELALNHIRGACSTILSKRTWRLLPKFIVDADLEHLAKDNSKLLRFLLGFSSNDKWQPRSSSITLSARPSPMPFVRANV